MRRDFVANTSHELKTPVGAVSLLAEAIESAADDPDQVRDFAGRLTSEASRLALLTSRIMNLSRLQSADELTEERVVAVDEVVAASLEAHAIQAESAGVAVVRGGTRGLFVRGDAQVLTEAVGNLIANAIAYSPKGSSVGVGVKARRRTSSRSRSPIAESASPKAIRTASSSDSTEPTRRAPGAPAARGLGLSIVKHAVQRHGGEVVLWSRPGRGSTFTIRLPLTDTPADQMPPKKRKRANRRAASGKASLAVPTNGDTA